MSRALAVLTALKALVAAAVPMADINGFIEDASPPERVEEQGAVTGEYGDPGDPEVEFSPLSYVYTHRIPVDFCMPAIIAGDTVPDSVIAGRIAPIGAAVMMDRTLGGLCDFLQVTAPEYSSQAPQEDGVPPFRIASFFFVAEYTVSDPLGV